MFDAMRRASNMGHPRMSLGVQDNVEEQEADRREDDVVDDEEPQPQAWIALASEDRGGGLDHRQQGWDRDGE